MNTPPHLLPFVRNRVRSLEETLAAAPPLTPNEEKIIRFVQEPPAPKVSRRQRIADGIASLGKLHTFIGPRQAKLVAELIRTSEERDYFIDKMAELATQITDMPATYEQQNEADPICHLHYYVGACDWWIIEKDVGADDDTPADCQRQAYGFACLGDPKNAECAYIPLPEIFKAGAELDFNWTPTPLSAVRAKLLA